MENHCQVWFIITAALAEHYDNLLLQHFDVYWKVTCGVFDHLDCFKERVLVLFLSCACTRGHGWHDTQFCWCSIFHRQHMQVQRIYVTRKQTWMRIMYVFMRKEMRSTRMLGYTVFWRETMKVNITWFVYLNRPFAFFKPHALQEHDCQVPLSTAPLRANSHMDESALCTK